MTRLEIHFATPNPLREKLIGMATKREQLELLDTYNEIHNAGFFNFVDLFAELTVKEKGVGFAVGDL